MNDRERFLATMHFEPVDRIPLWDFGYWAETLPEWRKQGMPGDVHPDAFFHRDRQWERVGVSVGMCPPFEEEVLEEDADKQLMIDSDGVKLLKMKHTSSIPKFVEFPVKTRDDFEAMKERYDPNSPARYPPYWEEKVRTWRERDYPLGIGAGSFYGELRRWMGVENLSMAFYDDPEWVQEMIDFLADHYVACMKRALNDVQLDYASFWEDMAFNKASLISPAMWRGFLTRPYQKVTSTLRQAGVDIILVDSDGTMMELTPCWLEAGVNVMFPMEGRCNDPLALREQLGRKLLILGAVDKFALMGDRKRIEEEVLGKVRTLIRQGGYIPTVDHRVPPDVPLENYLYCLELIDQIADEACTEPPP
jgi:uroporphyrinogen-III decarboxylase